MKQQQYMERLALLCCFPVFPDLPVSGIWRENRFRTGSSPRRVAFRVVGVFDVKRCYLHVLDSSVLSKTLTPPFLNSGMKLAGEHQTKYRQQLNKEQSVLKRRNEETTPTLHFAQRLRDQTSSARLLLEVSVILRRLCSCAIAHNLVTQQPRIHSTSSV